MNPSLFRGYRGRFGGVIPSFGGTQGLTLVELLVVLAILASIAAFVTVGLFSDGVTLTGPDGRERSQEEIATVATMQAVRDALVGGSINEPGYLQDLGALPVRLAYLIQNIGGVEPEPFDPATKRGWRGSYIRGIGARYEDFVEADNSDNFDDDDGNPYGVAGDPAILDAWRKPLLLQEPDTDDARLVSAGPNRILETDPANGIDADRGDDLVLFLLTEDPNP